MKNLFLPLFLCFLFCIGIQEKVEAQPISIYQYRQVPNDKIDEFIYKETTYWSEVARKALDKGNLQFWALFQRVGGFDVQNQSNFLFINNVNDVDKLGEIWNPSAVFPDVPMDQMETNSISKVTGQLFMMPENHVDDVGATPAEDYNYVKFNYIHATNPGQLIDLEEKHWKPFITAAMAKEGVSQVAWGNARLLSPLRASVPATTLSYDIYPTLHEALAPKWDETLEIPQDELMEINKLEDGRRSEAIYRIVKVVSSN